ncbi:MAG: sulfite exporter TauE/SafE family protein [Bacteroidota bacterium]|nr:sulfite exporter TauE/SafE family protein [Bacteroidota bacterium]
MQTILILLLVGVAAGMLSGLVGIGGGIIIVPALVFFLGFSQKMAQGTSLGILLLPIGILAVMQFYKAGYIDMKSVWLVSLGFLAGGYFGSKFALSLPQDTLKKIFAVVLLLVAFKILFLDKKIKETATSNTHQKKENYTNNIE